MRAISSSLTEKEQVQMRRLKLEGMTRSELAQRFQVSESTVRRTLARPATEEQARSQKE
ncbi:MAG: helix-turn-helix domain-containing protein [Actinomycetales bacterium]